MNRRVVAAALVMAGVAGASRAAVLWDQSAIDLNAPTSLANCVAPGFNGVVAFGVSDVSVPAGGWQMQSVTTYFSALSWNPGDVTQAVLNYYPKTGSLPLAANDPRAAPTGNGTLVNVTMTGMDASGNGVWAISASGLNVPLAAGNWWVGLTPIGPAGPFGPDYQWVTSNYYGDNQAYRSPPGAWIDEAVDYGVAHADGAILIEGTSVPSPASLGLLGLGGLVTLRRRR